MNIEEFHSDMEKALDRMREQTVGEAIEFCEGCKRKVVFIEPVLRVMKEQAWWYEAVEYTMMEKESCPDLV